ncbi:EAL domain-containing protein (putative c-di-GMP-specific phosphodiesterase class I) [Krasilnikovia cinnamomea]|uniref:EAL domain-containing protein (Putative c-di-GMP-specific phosphodiesterase class I) n=1 Tax=Krasilnikovia cinnamomea TaxID=349313 RepID=A0A4Q7ZP86_9ACTN|nr:EAL domain-containing protein [Krasilnikovia cinnamomea]RZU52225.1 EAL domain-containing protein (putative c-di-GMP-specific phosphodiesterase class I) [Krasilnikovia cinnamomea]
MTVLFRRETSLPSPVAAMAGRMGTPRPTDGATIEKIVEQRLLTAEFQPLVSLGTRHVVGFEALARGPADTQFASPAAMLTAAATKELLTELDMVARAVAADVVLKADLPEETMLFVNALPQGLLADAPDDLADVLRRALRRYRIVTEIDEAVLTGDPLMALAAANRVRALGVRVAIDNFGASTDALALLPLLAPDVIKLDMGLLAHAPNAHAAMVLDAVYSYRQATGALVVAQGVEHDHQLPFAAGLGARLGQGYLFGAAATVPQLSGEGVDSITLPAPVALQDDDPEALVLPGEEITAPGSLVRELAARLERTATNSEIPAATAIVCPDGRFPSGVPLTAANQLARNSAMTLLLAPHAELRPIRRAHMASLPNGDPLFKHTVIAILTPSAAAALVATADPNTEDTYTYRFSRDPEVATRLLHHLLKRAAHDA